jgi:hypothetical protein
MDYLEGLEKDLPEIERKIFSALQRNPGGLKRGQLVAIAYGENVKAGATNNNNSKDRAVRLAISSLRMRMVPIVSSSKGAGYRLDTSKESRDRMLADLISRRNKLNDLIERAAKFYSAPSSMPERETAKQAGML